MNHLSSDQINFYFTTIEERPLMPSYLKYVATTLVFLACILVVLICILVLKYDFYNLA